MPWLTSRRNLFVLLLAAVGLAGYALSGRCFTTPDPFYFSVASREVWLGKVLYRDIWVDRPLLVLVFYLVPSLLQPGSHEFLQFFCGVLLLIQAGIVYAMLRKENERAALLCAGVYFFLPFVRPEYTAISANHLANFFVMPLLLLAIRFTDRKTFTLGECLLMGICAGGALHTRQNTVLAALIPAFALLLTDDTAPRKARAFATAAAGFAGVSAAVIAAVALVGDVRGYFDLLFRFGSASVRLGTWTAVFNQLDVFMQSVLLPLTLLTFVPLAILLRKRPAHLAVLALAAGIGFFLCLSTRRYVIHYWPSWFPFLVFAFYWTMRHLPDEQARDRLMLAPLIGVIALNFVFVLTEFALRPTFSGERIYLSDIARTFKAATGPEDTLLALGQQMIFLNYATGLRPTSSLPWDVYLSEGWKDLRPWSREKCLEEIERNPPTWIAATEEVARSADRAGPDDLGAAVWKRFSQDPRYRQVEVGGDARFLTSKPAPGA